MKALTALGEALQHLVMLVKTSIRYGALAAWILAYARMTTLRPVILAKPALVPL